MHRLLSLAFALLLPLPLWAQEMRTITDHAGLEVSIPADPQRIVSLHDWTATVMVHELGGNLIGSIGRIDKNGGYFIRSGRELYGLTFDQIALASVHGMLDMEQIAALKPDLIIGNVGDTMAYRDQLLLIAPTIMFDPMNGRPPVENYRDLAGWVNRTVRFEELEAAYQARIASMRERLTAINAPSYITLLPNAEAGTIRILRTYGALTTVLDDLGFTQGAIMDEVPQDQQEAAFSAELIGQLDTDWIFATHIVDQGETPETIMAELDAIAPGYRNFVPAVRAGQFISLSRFHVYPTTFAAMDHVLEELERLIKP